MSGEPVFGDTSGFLALLDTDDVFHSVALAEWKSMAANGCILWTSDYVRLECGSLIQRRLGAAALRDFHDAILVLARVFIVEEEGFERAFEKWRLVQSRQWSLVDITSFDCMRQKGITQAFTFDSQFAQQGFITCLSEEG